MLATPYARGESAQKTFLHTGREFCDAIKVQLGIQAAGPHCSYFFSLAPATVPLPLGWMLSNRAVEAMQKEMLDSGLSAKAPVPTWNQAMLNQVIAALHSKTDQ